MKLMQILMLAIALFSTACAHKHCKKECASPAQGEQKSCCADKAKCTGEACDMKKDQCCDATKCEGKCGTGDCAKCAEGKCDGKSCELKKACCDAGKCDGKCGTGECKKCAEGKCDGKSCEMKKENKKKGAKAKDAPAPVVTPAAKQ